MQIAIIGAGHMGMTLARRWAEKGHEIVFGSRDPEKTVALAATIGPSVRAASASEAVAGSDPVVLAFPWFAATDIFRAVGAELQGKVVIDPINPLMSSGRLALGHKTSAAEEMQRWSPRAKLIKAFNHLHFEVLANPLFGDEGVDAFYCSNHDDAKAIVATLAADLSLNPVDCGPLRNARLLEPLALFWIQMAYNQGWGTDFALKLVRRER